MAWLASSRHLHTHLQISKYFLFPQLEQCWHFVQGNASQHGIFSQIRIWLCHWQLQSIFIHSALAGPLKFGQVKQRREIKQSFIPIWASKFDGIVSENQITQTWICLYSSNESYLYICSETVFLKMLHQLSLLLMKLISNAVNCSIR